MERDGRLVGIDGQSRSCNEENTTIEEGHWKSHVGVDGLRIWKDPRTCVGFERGEWVTILLIISSSPPHNSGPFGLRGSFAVHAGVAIQHGK